MVKITEISKHIQMNNMKLLHSVSGVNTKHDKNLENPKYVLTIDKAGSDSDHTIVQVIMDVSTGDVSTQEEMDKYMEKYKYYLQLKVVGSFKVTIPEEIKEDKKDEYLYDTVTRVCSHILTSNLRSYIREVLHMMGQDVNSFPLYSFFDPQHRTEFNKNKKE